MRFGPNPDEIEVLRGGWEEKPMPTKNKEPCGREPRGVRGDGPVGVALSMTLTRTVIYNGTPRNNSRTGISDLIIQGQLVKLISKSTMTSTVPKMPWLWNSWPA